MAGIKEKIGFCGDIEKDDLCLRGIPNFLTFIISPELFNLYERFEKGEENINLVKFRRLFSNIEAYRSYATGYASFTALITTPDSMTLLNSIPLSWTSSIPAIP